MGNNPRVGCLNQEGEASTVFLFMRVNERSVYHSHHTHNDIRENYKASNHQHVEPRLDDRWRRCLCTQFAEGNTNPKDQQSDEREFEVLDQRFHFIFRMKKRRRKGALSVCCIRQLACESEEASEVYLLQRKLQQLALELQ